MFTLERDTEICKVDHVNVTCEQIVFVHQSVAELEKTNCKRTISFEMRTG